MHTDIRRFESVLTARLMTREHLVLYGPRGSGKSTLLGKLHAHFTGRGIPCALSTATAHLDDITRALERAYPHIETAVTTRRRARSRLRSAADRNEGMLLLDHVTGLSNAMVGFLRRLRGGIAGVLLAIDTDTERECQRVRGCYRGMFALPMPPATAQRLHGLLRSCCADRDIPPIAAKDIRRIVHAARGRPGWVVQCVALMAYPRYWRNGTPLVTALCSDTEIALRLGYLTQYLQESEATCKSVQ